MLLALGALSVSGCTLVTDVDRSKIPPENAPPSSTPDAGQQPVPDSGPPAEPPPEPTLDAGSESDAATTPEIPADSGEPAPVTPDAGDAG